MPIVRFLPAEIEVKLPSGELLHEAAIRAGVDDLHLPCGGEGTCGQCLVEVVSGSVRSTGHSALEAALDGEGLVLACQAEVHGDLVVRLLEGHDAALRVVGDSKILISEDLLPSGYELSPLCRTRQLTVPPASIEEHYSDWLRVVRELERLCDPSPVRTDLLVLRELAESLRSDRGRITVLLEEEAPGTRVREVRSGHAAWRPFGLAIDVGTTTVALQLVSLADGRVLASRASYNGQICRGADIISRIDYARTDARRRELSRLVLETINTMIAEVIAEVEVTREDLCCALVAGNTTMIHLLLELPPQHIRETPYVPTVNPVPGLTAEQVGLAILPQAPVACAPGVGSYVGGDITAGILCTEMLKSRDEVFLFIDVGTNGEIVLGNAEWLVGCACSAGPAFEGSGIKCGMRATKGAIEQLTIEPDASRISYDVIGGGKPVGICGSGLISLLGELFLRGFVDRSGHLDTERGGDRLVQAGSSRGLVLETGDKTRDGQDLVITEADIENLMRTKAAIYAACDLLTRNVGIGWDAIARVYIAGGFGRYIQAEAAVMIGMLPDLSFERFTYLGNSALTGAYIALLSREHRMKLAEVASRMTYIDLSSEPGYMDSYMSATFLPHTNMTLFPSVARRLEGGGTQSGGSSAS